MLGILVPIKGSGIAVSPRNRTLRGLDPYFPAFEFVDGMPVGTWKSIFDRAEAQHTFASAAEGVQSVHEFMRAESGYLDVPRVLSQAGAP